MKNSPILKRAQGESCKVAVLGYGVSNRPLVEWLLAHGISPAQLTVRDRREPGELAASGDAARLRALGVPVISGAGYLAGLDGTGVIFRTPGIRPDLPDLRDGVISGVDRSGCAGSHRFRRQDNNHYRSVFAGSGLPAKAGVRSDVPGREHRHAASAAG